MSGIVNLLQKLSGTREAEILLQIEKSYENISSQQSEWYKKSRFFCPDGCGECCRSFEPDLLECEALYMAAWLLENQPEIAEAVSEGIFPFPRESACQFWNENAKYHCSIYEGRPAICRLFGACGNNGKYGGIVFKPCKFYPAEKLAEKNPLLQHRQYSTEEIKKIFSVLPPVMSDLMEMVISIDSENQETSLIRNVLPETIKKLKWILSLNVQ